MPKTIQKVFAYITHNNHLLVFRQPYSPEADVQVPAGTIKAGEQLEAAVMRKALEETGLSELSLGGYLGEDYYDEPERDEIHHRHFYHLHCPSTPSITWRHQKVNPPDSGGSESIEFEFFWVSLSRGVPELAPGHDKMLPKLLDLLSQHPQPVGPIVEPADNMGSLRQITLSGKYITLRPIHPDRDAPELFEVSHGSLEKQKIWTYMGYGPFANVAEMKAWLIVQAQSTDPLFFSVINNATDKRIGVVSFLNIVPAMQRLEVGHIWYGTDYQRTKVNTESIYLLLNEAFDRLRCRRVEWKCDALNERSRRAALRLGFTFEGVFRQHMIVKGRSRDTAWFSMLDYEWPGIKQNMERWLYKDESHPSGKSGVSLEQLNAHLKND